MEYLKAPDRFNLMGTKPPHGVLLEGPPGCGKVREGEGGYRREGDTGEKEIQERMRYRREGGTGEQEIR